MTAMPANRVQLPDSFRPMTMAEGLRASASRDPNKPALTFGRQVRRWRELIERVDCITHAAIADLGLVKGDIVGLIAANCIEYIEIVCGVAESGAAVATINPRLTATELEAICEDSGARVLFVDSASAPVVRAAKLPRVERIIVIGPDFETWLRGGVASVPRPRIEEWDTWTVPYTSGTTGKPKGVMLSHRSRIVVAMLFAVEFGCFSADDRYLAITPMNHGAGLGFPMACLLGGGSVDILPGFDAETVLRKFKYGGITGVFMVPTHFHAIFSLGNDLLEECRGNMLRAIISNAAPLSQAMKQKIVPYFGERVLNEIYGATESGLVSNLRPPFQLIKQQCVGTPFSHTRLRILDELGRDCAPGEVGEIFCNSPVLFNGYLNRPAETAAAFRDGWLTVGDLGKRDDDGFLYIVDRKSDMVISGGTNIYPREIEEVLIRHPSIGEVAAVGVPDERLGERLKAFVVLRAGTHLSFDELVVFCTPHLSRYKLPRELAIVDRLPRNANGKVLKRELRERESAA